MRAPHAHFSNFITALARATRYPSPPARPKPRAKEVPTELFDFSGDETLAFFFCGAASAGFLFRWYVPLFTVTRLGTPAPRLMLALAPPACLAALLPVLVTFGSHELREDHGYIVLFMLGGVLWMGLAALLSSALGISRRQDALERRNRPAAVVLGGALLGVTLTYAGANIGEGATIWMTFGPAVLATLAWAAAWGVYQALTGAADAVAIDRRADSAWRLAGLLVATGLILGRSVAGDFESIDRTLADFARQGWPVVPLLLTAAWLERRARSATVTPTPPAREGSANAAVAYVVTAAIYVACLGPWNHVAHGGGR